MSAPDLWAAGALPRALFEQSPFSTVIYDAAGRPLAANAAFSALWGGVTLDAVPAGYTVLADPQLERQGALPLVRRAFAGAGERVVTPPVRFDMAKLSTTGAGRAVWTEGHWYPVRDAGGRLTHVVLVHTDITERVQAERAIREGEERLRLAQQVAHIGTFDWHVPSGRVAWTEEEERLFGIAPGTFDGTIEGWARFVLPEDAAGIQAAMAAAMARGDREMDLAFRIRRPDGAVRHIEGRGAVLYAEDGTPSRMVGVNVDVTDRRRNEEELARGERALRAAVARTTRLQRVTAAFARALTAAEIARVTLDEGLAVLGAQSAIVYLADVEGRTLTAAATLGLAPGALGPWSTVDPDGPAMTAEAMRAGAPRYVQTRAERVARYPATRDVAASHESWAALPLVQNGRRLGAITVGFAAPHAFPPEERAFVEAVAQQCAQALERARLYEDERSARATARAAADRLQTVADAARLLNERSLDPDAMVDALADVLSRRLGDECVVRLATPDGEWLEPGAARHPDPERQALLVSLHATERYHVTDGLTGAVYRSGESLLLPEADREALRASMKPAYRPWVERLGMYSVLCVPLRGRASTLGTVWLSRDAPGRPYGDDDLALVEDVAGRAGLLLEGARLYAAERRARTEAEEASRAKSDFLAAMSHELRTPLNGIGGYVELLEMGIRGPVTDEQRADLERIRRNQRHLLALIEDVLSFARVEAGRLEVERVPVPLEETLQSLEALVLPQMASQGLAFTLAPCGPGLVAVGDRERIVQVCVNLLTNAVKATPRGGAVTLWCEADDETARVRVRDTGVGIPADKLEAIFSPFTQLGRSLSNPRAGAGLGLSISRGLAEAMGGALTVESAEGEGSTFTLALRRA